MEYITKKVSYLKGLAEGYGLNGEKDNLHNVVLSIIDCLELMSEEISFLDSDFQRLEEYIEMVDDDLSELEMVFDDDCDCGCYCDCDDYDYDLDDDWDGDWNTDNSDEEEDDEE